MFRHLMRASNQDVYYTNQQKMINVQCFKNAFNKVSIYRGVLETEQATCDQCF